MAGRGFEISQGAGIVRDAQGFAFIPASRRPDGTWRKARRVKDGYVPDEDVARYKTKAVKTRESAPACPGMSIKPTHSTHSNSRQSVESISSHAASSISEDKNLSKSAKKNLKRKEQRQKKKDEDIQASVMCQYESVKGGANPGASLDRLNEGLNQMSISSDPKQVSESDKRLKVLRKKLRQIQELKEKIDKGMLPNPDPMQLDKIAKEDEIEHEIYELMQSNQ